MDDRIQGNRPFKRGKQLRNGGSGGGGVKRIDKRTNSLSQHIHCGSQTQDFFKQRNTAGQGGACATATRCSQEPTLPLFFHPRHCAPQKHPGFTTGFSGTMRHLLPPSQAGSPQPPGTGREARGLGALASMGAGSGTAEPPCPTDLSTH